VGVSHSGSSSCLVGVAVPPSEPNDDPRNLGLPESECGFPMDAELRHLTYPVAGLHVRSRAERKAFEDRMREGARWARAYGVPDQTWDSWLMYL